MADKAAAKERARKRRESIGYGPPASPVLHPSVPSASVIGADGEKICREKSPKRGTATATEGQNGGGVPDSGVACASQKGVSHKKEKGASHKKARVAKGAEDETSRVTLEEVGYLCKES